MSELRGAPRVRHRSGAARSGDVVGQRHGRQPRALDVKLRRGWRVALGGEEIAADAQSQVAVPPAWHVNVAGAWCRLGVAPSVHGGMGPAQVLAERLVQALKEGGFHGLGLVLEVGLAPAGAGLRDPVGVLGCGPDAAWFVVVAGDPAQGALGGRAGVPGRDAGGGLGNGHQGPAGLHGECGSLLCPVAGMGPEQGGGLGGGQGQNDAIEAVGKGLACAEKLPALGTALQGVDGLTEGEGDVAAQVPAQRGHVGGGGPGGGGQGAAVGRKQGGPRGEVALGVGLLGEALEAGVQGAEAGGAVVEGEVVQGGRGLGRWLLGLLAPLAATGRHAPANASGLVKKVGRVALGLERLRALAAGEARADHRDAQGAVSGMGVMWGFAHGVWGGARQVWTLGWLRGLG